MSDAQIIAAVVPVVAALQDLKIAYYLTGSVVSSIYGLGRSTNDVDVVADMQSPQVARFVERLSSGYYVDDRMIQGAIARKSSFNVICLSNQLKVDIYIPKDVPFDRSALSRARGDNLAEDGTAPVMVASVEDSILSKLAWYRLGGHTSERQWTDVLGMVSVQKARLDLPYLQRMAAILVVGDLLEKALSSVK